MRTTFLKTLLELAEHDDRIWLLTGDLGYSVLEPFATQYPDRFVNMGVAEQNMAGVAAGLAMTGKVVFVYSIANFPVMRCLEQIRNDVCYHNLDVKIVAVGCGLAYGSHGYTHHGVEDIAIMRVLPNMTVVAPADPVETRLATRAIVKRPGPAYLRLGKANEPIMHVAVPDFEIGKAIEVCSGSDLTLVSTGSVLGLALEAQRRLCSEGWSVQVLSMPTVAPLDISAVLDAARRTSRIITIEEHGPGGLGTVVAEVLAEAGYGIRFHALRLPPGAIKEAGSQSTLLKARGLSGHGVAQCARRMLGVDSTAGRTEDQEERILAVP
jgi:transketolase